MAEQALQLRVDDLKEKLAAQVESHGNVASVEALSPRMRSIEGWTATIKRLNEAIHLYKQSKIPLVGMESMFSVAKELQTVLDRIKTNFEKDRASKSLTKGDDWTNFSETIEALEKDDPVLKCWQAYLRTQFSGERPLALNKTLHQSAGNKRRMKEYEEVYGKFQERQNVTPRDREAIKETTKVVNSLVGIHKQFEIRDIPKPVQVFLQKVSDGTATLSLLDKDVLKWLTKENELDEYFITLGDPDRNLY